MATNKKPKKKYRPREADKLPVIYRFSAENETYLQLLPHNALAKIKVGEFSEEDWHTLASRVNLGNTLAYQWFDTEEAKATMNAAVEAVRAIWVRHEKLSKWGATGEEHNLIAAGLNLTDEMQANCTRRELRESMRYVIQNAAINRRNLSVDTLLHNAGV